MTLAELRDALKAKGFQYLSDTEAEDFVKQAVLDTHTADDWRLRLTRVNSVASGATIADLGPIEAVFYSGRELDDVDSEADAIRRYGNDVSTGDPQIFWVTGSGVSFLPSGRTVDVVHLSTAPWTNGGSAPTDTTDTPKIPSRFHDAILLRARQSAYEETDETELAMRMEARWAGRLTEMRRELISGAVKGPGRVRQTQPWA